MTTYTLWWISKDGQLAVETDYPSARYATVEAAEDAIASARAYLAAEARAVADEDPGAEADILAGRFAVEKTLPAYRVARNDRGTWDILVRGARVEGGFFSRWAAEEHAAANYAEAGR